MSHIIGSAEIRKHTHTKEKAVAEAGLNVKLQLACMLWCCTPLTEQRHV
jgi:hypothetical protein